MPTGTAGDINHDGFSDLLVGSYLDDAFDRVQAGIVYVIFGYPNVSSTYPDINLDVDFSYGGFKVSGGTY